MWKCAFSCALPSFYAIPISHYVCYWIEKTKCRAFSEADFVKRMQLISWVTTELSASNLSCKWRLHLDTQSGNDNSFSTGNFAILHIEIVVLKNANEVSIFGWLFFFPPSCSFPSFMVFNFSVSVCNTQCVCVELNMTEKLALKYIHKENSSEIFNKNHHRWKSNDATCQKTNNNNE